MPAIAKQMPRPPASAAASSHEAPEEPDVDQVLEMENDDNQDDIVVDEEEYHLGMLGGDEAWIGECSTEKGEAERVGDSDTAPPGGSLPGLLNPGQRALVNEEYQLGMIEGADVWTGWCTVTKGDAGKA
eukprot:5003380-Amphidinium_carterae.1